MIAIEEILNSSNLFARAEETFCHVVAGIPLFAELGATPDKLLATRVAAILLHDLRAAAQSIVRKLHSVCGASVVDCNQPLRAIPFIGFRPIAGQITI